MMLCLSDVRLSVFKFGVALLRFLKLSVDMLGVFKLSDVMLF